MFSSFPMTLRRLLGFFFLLAGVCFCYQVVAYDTSPRNVSLHWVESIEGFTLPGIPNSLGPSLGADEIQVQIMKSPEQVAALAKVAGPMAVVAQRPGVALLIDGQLFSSNPTAISPLLSSLGLEHLPIVVNQLAKGVSYTLPDINSGRLESSLQLQLYKTLQVLRDTVQAHLLFFVLVALGAALFWVLTPARYKFATQATRFAEEIYREAPKQQATSAVRVVLVKNRFELKNARVAIGEEHILAATENAFAFARGWILAVRDGSVFDLIDHLGWSHMGIEIFSESDMRDSPIPGVDRSWCAAKPRERGKAYDLVDALSLCGGIAHAEGVPIR